MRSLILMILLLLPLPAARAQGTGMQWWNGNGDSIVLGGITVTLDGTGIQQDNGALHDADGTDNAALHFTFNPPAGSLRLWFSDVDYDEKIVFGTPLPDHVQYLELDPVGTPINTVQGFFYDRAGTGFVYWDGPNIASLDFTMSYSSGSIQLLQMDLNPSYQFKAGAELRPFPDASPAGISLQLAIADPPSGYSGAGFIVERQAMYPCDGQTATIATLPRAPGTLQHVWINDLNVSPGSSYRYRVMPLAADYDQFLSLFDPTGWGFDIEAFAAPTSPVMPMILGHGKLVSFEPTAATLEPCSDSCLRYVSGFFSPAVSPYVDTGVDVVVTGTMGYAGNNYGTIAHFETAVPTTCTVSVEASTWTNVKTLYR